MANQLRVTLEIGLQGKQVAAVAPDWPGLERGAKTGEAALERLHSYLPRYAQVAKLAGMEAEFAALSTVEVVEHYAGTGSTDFWGISFAFSSIDRQDLSNGELERELSLMQACWAFFDGVRWRVSAQMRDVPPRGRAGSGSDRRPYAARGARVGREGRGAHPPRCDAEYMFVCVRIFSRIFNLGTVKRTVKLLSRKGAETNVWNDPGRFGGAPCGRSTW